MFSIHTREKGQSFYLKGSDYLLEAEKDLMSIKKNLEDTSIARYIEFCRGSRLNREFKTVSGNKIIKRDKNPKEALSALKSSISPTRDKEQPFNDILTNEIHNKIADIQIESGKRTEAKNTMSELIDHLKKVNAPAYVIQLQEKKYG